MNPRGSNSSSTLLPNLLGIVSTCILLLLLCAPSPAATDSEFIEQWADHEQAASENRLATSRQRMVRAEQALEKSVAVLHYAERIKDAQAASVARRAQDTARLAIKKYQQLITRELTILTQLEKARRLKKHSAFTITNRGKTLLKRGETWEPFSANSVIVPGDEVSTGPGGYMELIFTDGSKVHLDENTTFKLLELDDTRSVYEKISGRFHAVIEQMKSGRERRYMVTPTACACVRGTEFVISAPAIGPKSVTVIEGVLDIYDPAVNVGNAVAVHEGQRISITEEGVIEGPTAATSGSVDQWWMN